MEERKFKKSQRKIRDKKDSRNYKTGREDPTYT